MDINHAFAFISGIVKTHNLPEANEALDIIRVAIHRKPHTSPEDSITPDYLICLEDGAKLKMLKRYLWVNYGMRPDDYRRKWGLPKDYPMVVPNYSKQRSGLAKQNGLGKKKAA
jgi:predicted transcriptional regulator